MSYATWEDILLLNDELSDEEKLIQVSAKQFANTILAPIVIQKSKAGDAAAIQLLQKAADAVDLIGMALERAQPNQTLPLPCVLLGGVAPFLKPYLSDALHSRLAACKNTPEAGAVMMIRSSIMNQCNKAVSP